MKLLTFHEFCALPDGVIYQEYKPHYLGSLCVRGEVLRYHANEPRDFCYADLTPGTPADKSCTIEWPSGSARWGVFDYSIRYLVWDDDDISRLCNWLNAPQLALKDADAELVIDIDCDALTN